MAEERDIKYINREFGDFKSQLIEYAKNYFPDAYNDFSPTSPGMMFIEMASYLGDVLSFYQDTQLQETFLQHAQNPSNLYSLAYMMGYKPRVSTPSEVILTVSQLVDATTSNFTPNWDQALTILENSVVSSTVGDNLTFLLDNNVDFNFSSSYDKTDITIASLDSGDNNPAEYRLTKKVKATAGTIKTVDKSFTTAEKFTTIEIADTDIIGVLDITDSDGNTWYEVPFLGQETIFDSETNTNSDNNLTPTVLTLRKVPRRFVTRFTSKGVMQVQFGAGLTGTDNSDFLPNPINIQGIGSKKTLNKLEYSYDPSNFLFTSTYGLAPSDTTLTIRYLTGGGVESNVPANTVTILDTINASAVDNSKLSTLTFDNLQPAQGGKDADTVEELRENSLRSFSEQQRTVTPQDFTVRALSLPAEYGTIAKVYVTQDFANNSNVSVLDRNPLSISLYSLAYDENKNLVKLNNTLRDNLKTYLSQFMTITDAVEIKDAFIVNIGIKFEIVTRPNEPSRDILLNCTNELKKYFNIDRWNINQPINLAEVYTLLDKVKGVQTVKNITVINKAGGNYSEFGYDVQGATKDRVVYPSFDPCIFEVKFPDNDIEGRVTTL